MAEKIRCVNKHNPALKRYFNANVVKGAHFKKNWEIADPAHKLDEQLMAMPPEKPRDIQTERAVAREKEREKAKELEVIPFNAIKKDEIIIQLREKKVNFDPKAAKGVLYGLLYPNIKSEEVVQDNVQKEPVETVPIEDLTKAQIIEQLKEKGIEHDSTSKKLVLYNLLYDIKNGN